MFRLFSIFGAVGLFRLSFLTWFGHDFSAGQFLSVLSFLIAATTCRDILDFSYRPLSHVLHVTLSNLQ